MAPAVITDKYPAVESHISKFAHSSLVTLQLFEIHSLPFPYVHPSSLHSPSRFHDTAAPTYLVAHPFPSVAFFPQPESVFLVSTKELRYYMCRTPAPVEGKGRCRWSTLHFRRRTSYLCYIMVCSFPAFPPISARCFVYRFTDFASNTSLFFPASSSSCRDPRCLYCAESAWRRYIPCLIVAYVVWILYNT